MTAAFRRGALSAAALCAFAFSLAAPVASAQGADAPRTKHRTPRRLVYSLIGVGVGTGLAALYSSVGKEGPGGTCSSSACVGTALIGGGALVGFMVGREFDQLHRMRYRGGAPLTPSAVSTSLAGEPLVLAVRDSVVAVGGTTGIQLFTSSGNDLKAGVRRGTGIRGIEALEVAPGAHALVVGSQTGVYLYPPGGGLGLLLREGRASALAAGRDRIWFGVGTRIEGAPLTADTARGWPGLDVGRHVDMLLVDEARGLVWALADSSLLALRPAGDSLERVGSLALGGPARRLSLQGDRMAVALGEGGVRLLDVRDPAAPRELAAWRGTRYVYDVSLAGSRLYAASGVDGLYVLGTAGDSLTTLGLARELGFASALQSHGGYTYLIDRSTNMLRRISSGF